MRWSWSGGGGSVAPPTGGRPATTSIYTLVAADAGKTLEGNCHLPRRNGQIQAVTAQNRDRGACQLATTTILFFCQALKLCYVRENRTGISVSYSATDDDVDDTLTYSVEGADAADFSMNLEERFANFYRRLEFRL